MTISKPKIFISSTIYDFKDLRSALKYWLEKLGYVVLLSEFNDFTKPLDKNSFHACLDTITQSDYYILFIGSRVGGYYSSSDRVSITRKEYRTAYEVMKTKKLKIVAFVREELLTIRTDRKSLQDFLEQDLVTRKELSPKQVSKLVNHSSNIINDVEVIIEFIDEVMRVSEMNDAVNGKGPFPIGNWVHTYSIFQDIVDVLSLELGISDSLSHVALIENLERELFSNLIVLTEKNKGDISPTHRWASYARRFLTEDMSGMTRMPGRYLRCLAVFSLIGGTSQGLSTRFIDHALLSGEFLDYDRDAHTYKSGLMNNAIFELQKNINRLRYLETVTRSSLVDFVEKYKDLSKTEEEVSISNTDLVFPIALADCQQNVVNLTIGLLKAINGDLETLAVLQLNPTTPLIAEAAKIVNETPTMDELKKWVSKL